MMKFLLLPMLLPFLMAMTMSGCEDEDGDGGGRFRSEATIHYYNQITSQGAADENNLTANITLENEDESDSATGIGYSRESEGPELSVRIDDTNDNEDNSVSFEGVNPNGGQLFRERLRLANDTRYTAVSYGDTSTGNTDALVIQQDQSDVESGSSRFRVINTVDPDNVGAFSFDLRYNDAGSGNYFASDLDRGEDSGYQTTNAGGLNLVVVSNGYSPERVLARMDCSLSGGRAYDVILAASDPLNPPLTEGEAEDGLVIYCHPHERD
ncbi:DUF4397 domain-containing protein [Alloalcanivorax xenomutans]|uniref:DUF4397 domain-containing protein n=1 Tax=Alloalcanivorax xenomutans TaxID=1094342 RepID=A0A9Q3ZEV3_9GAMM|nr:DUF4397 domain-containing protein [Alloalcanivorax xenomutans]MCE7511110.1 DUF4397 domain-containing protein [Alloalcanivorax xenomutans]